MDVIAGLGWLASLVALVLRGLVNELLRTSLPSERRENNQTQRSDLSPAPTKE